MYFSRCVATSCDANYFPALMALLRSLRRTNPDLPVVVFDGGLTKRQTRRARKFAIIIPKKPFMELEGRGKFKYIGDTTLLKFEVEGLNSKKVLYLDADTVVLEDLNPLFDFPKNSVGVVREVNALKNMFRLQHRERLMESIDVDWEKPGFNAGLFVLRPKEWQGLAERARGLVKKFGIEVFTKSKDQQLLNIIFRNKIHDFPKRYNFAPFYDETGQREPAILHYLTRCKPWHHDYPIGHRYKEFRSHVSIRDFPEILMVDIRRHVKNLLSAA
ncbi:MAG: glycosyltransferase [Candidatus Omnitrophota bacterium]